MHYADDSALVAHDAESMQRVIDTFFLAAEQFSLKINIKKTECLFQPVNKLSIAQVPEDILVHTLLSNRFENTMKLNTKPNSVRFEK